MRERVTFQGIHFYRYPESKVVAHQRYFRPGIADATRGVSSLHREIWMSKHGPIPAGCHIHHRDGDWNNNSLDNLACVTASEHRIEHADDHRTPAQLEHLKAIRPLAGEWHSSAEGLAWHKAHGAASWKNRKPKPAGACRVCGKAFESLRPEQAKFCSHACERTSINARGYSKRHELQCAHCGKSFMSDKRTAQCCSYACANYRRWQLKRSTHAVSTQKTT